MRDLCRVVVLRYGVVRPKPLVPTRQVVVRIPVDLYDALKADAEANGRTVTQSVRFLLKEALK